ncbi:hypothetical protein DsansV1_C42g0239421 [Dioscorea sansibarensis]
MDCGAAGDIGLGPVYAKKVGSDVTCYRISYGNSKDSVLLFREFRSWPMRLHCHDIPPRVLPLFYKDIRYNDIILLFIYF